jgi:hypothetical protein
LDLLGRGSSAIGQVEQTIRAIFEIQEEDGLVFDSTSVEGTKIKEDDEYDGVRIKLLADLAGARIPMQIDIGFGDAVYPEPELASFPVLLPMEAPVIRAYPRENPRNLLRRLVELVGIEPTASSLRTTRVSIATTCNWNNLRARLVR